MLSTNTPIVTTSSARAAGNTISNQLRFIGCEIEDQEYSVGFSWLLLFVAVCGAARKSYGRRPALLYLKYGSGRYKPKPEDDFK